MSMSWIYAIAFAAAASVVFGLIRVLSRPHGPGADEDEPLRILTRTRVGAGRTLVLVEVDGRRLLLGSTREQWSALADLGQVHASEEEAVYASIEDELIRASESARHRRLSS